MSHTRKYNQHLFQFWTRAFVVPGGVRTQFQVTLGVNIQLCNTNGEKSLQFFPKKTQAKFLNSSEK